MIARNLETRTVKTGRGGPQMILERRLSKLEASFLPKNSRPWRRMSGTEAECETAVRALIEAGQAQESDGFIFRIIVAPGEATGPS